MPRGAAPLPLADDPLPSQHGADKARKYNASEVARLAKYQMYTAEKWYTPCGSKGPTQSGPDCAIESVTEDLYGQIKAINPNVTTILYWNSMFDFSFCELRPPLPLS
jgi:hypothetical protein